MLQRSLFASEGFVSEAQRITCPSYFKACNRQHGRVVVLSFPTTFNTCAKLRMFLQVSYDPRELDELHRLRDRSIKSLVTNHGKKNTLLYSSSDVVHASGYCTINAAAAWRLLIQRGITYQHSRPPFYAPKTPL